MNLLALAVILVIVEVGLFIIVSLQRRRFPWLITTRDELPTFDFKALQKFIDYSFDPHLGWVRRPNSNGIENGQKGQITFHIDSIGSRANTFGKFPSIIAAFGVGNYGVDQALLRYECMTLPDTVRFVVMGFVPETICRIQSYWKHYLEFGNTFAFKPRFILDQEGRLMLLENL